MGPFYCIAQSRFSKRRHCSSIIIELKKVNKEEDLETCAENTVKQIYDRKYCANITRKSYSYQSGILGKDFEVCR